MTLIVDHVKLCIIHLTSINQRVVRVLVAYEEEYLQSYVVVV